MDKRLLILGNGGHAISCREVIDSTEEFNFAGFISKNLQNDKDIIGVDSDLEMLFESIKFACIGIGQIKSNAQRIASFNKLKQIGYTFPVIIASTAYVSSSAEINEGTIVMHKAFINSQSKLGINSIVNTGAIVEHGASVGNHCHIATKAIINGDATIGDNSFVGSGATILQGVNIGKNSIIGAGVIVKKNTEENSLIK